MERNLLKGYSLKENEKSLDVAGKKNLQQKMRMLFRIKLIYL